MIEVLNDLDLYFENLSVTKLNGNDSHYSPPEEFKTPIDFSYVIEPGTINHWLTM